MKKSKFYMLFLCMVLSMYGCGSEQAKQEDDVKHEHVEEVIDGTTATCTVSGLTGGKKCSTCGTVTVAQQTITATGHAYSNDSDLDCNNCGYVRGYWSDWIDNGINEVSETSTRQVKTEIISGSMCQYRYRRCVWYNSSGMYCSSQLAPLGYSEGNVQKGSTTYAWDYTNWYSTPVECIYKVYAGDDEAIATYDCDGTTYYTEEMQKISATKYRYGRYVWYNSSGVYCSSKLPPIGYSEGTVEKGSKAYKCDYTDWYSSPIECVLKTYSGYDEAITTYDCDGTTYYTEYKEENMQDEIHYFYRDVIYY